MVRTFGWERGPLVPLVTFTPYVGLLSVLPLVVALVARRWRAAAAGAVVVVLFAVALLPRAMSGPQPAVRGGVEVRVMASNLFVGHGDPRTIVGLVRREQVDVLALEELTPESVARYEAAGLRRLLPWRVRLRGQGGAAGSALYSRWPLRELEPVNPHPTQGEPRALVRVPGARPIDVQVIHPLPPTNAAWRRDWNETLGALAESGARAGVGSGETVRMLAGDFNATLDHARLRALLGGDDGYVDAADAVGKGYATTWPAGRRFPPEITIDHVLVDPRVRVEAVRVHLVPGSDHRAVVAVLRVPAG